MGWLLVAGFACAQQFPAKVIRIITGETGGGLDGGARIIAQGMAANIIQQVIVENRGGSAVIPAQALIKAQPDGYTILYYGNSIWLLPLLQSDVPYDAVRDFAPITMAVAAPNMLVVHPSLPVKSVKELIVLAKATPGGLNYASGISGSSNHLAAELFKSMAGVDIVRIAYKGTAIAFRDLVSGRVQVMFPPMTDIVLGSLVRSGKLRALAITSRTPSLLFPEVSTMDTAGLPGYEAGVSYALFAPANTPVAIVSVLNQELVRALNSAQVRDQFQKSGVSVVASSSEQLVAAMKSEIAKMEKVVKSAGIRAD